AAEEHVETREVVPKGEVGVIVPVGREVWVAVAVAAVAVRLLEVGRGRVLVQVLNAEALNNCIILGNVQSASVLKVKILIIQAGIVGIERHVAANVKRQLVPTPVGNDP